MRFCSVCSNLYYIRLAGDNGDNLIYYCRKCGHEEPGTIASIENMCVSQTDLQSSEDSYEHIINEYTKLDPTLPRLTNIKCPNGTCPTNLPVQGGGDSESPAQSEVLYLRYDDANMRFIYICAHCETVWKSAYDK